MTAKRTLALRPNPGAAVPETAMVMAAGLGKRMRPLTATRPKPLVPVAGKPLIDHVFDRLRAAGVRRAVVNVHYLADALEAHLKARVKDVEVVVSDERALLLETGGGLVKARPLLGDDPVVVINADSFWVDGPIDAIRALAAAWDERRMDVLLLMVPYARAHGYRGQGDFHLDALGRITGRRQRGRVAPFVYIGVQMIHPRVIADAPEGPFSTNVFWSRAIAAGRAWGLVHGGLWFEIGEPAAIAEAEAILADG